MIRNWLKKSREDQEGFSLVELMVVIVIIGLLTTVVVINVLPNQDRAMVEKARADIRILSQAAEMYRMDQRRYPPMEQGLEILTKAPEGSRYRTEGYIKSLPKDPWGNDYQYLVPGENASYDIFSFGADGRLGGEGMDADISAASDDEAI